MVPEDDRGPGFAYSIGLFHTFNHPEVLISGVDFKNGTNIINHIGAFVRDGMRFGAEQEASEILVEANCYFKRIVSQHYSDYLGTAVRFYGHAEFPALQCYWPDREGLYPFEEEAAEWVRERQDQLHL